MELLALYHCMVRFGKFRGTTGAAVEILSDLGNSWILSTIEKGNNVILILCLSRAATGRPRNEGPKKGGSGGKGTWGR